MNWPGRVVTSEFRIRPVVVTMFRRWFGHDPTFHWHKDGMMAEAWDDRGNRVEIQQHNHELNENVSEDGAVSHQCFYFDGTQFAKFIPVERQLENRKAVAA